jgi:glycosyltransferase involved in cell wall biosynthesis
MTTISVVLPTFNRTAFLKIAVQSVLAQSFTDWEIVIADDGSGEATREYLRSLDQVKVRIAWLPHSGNPSVVRNAAAAIARGRYLAFLDSDDVWEPAKLERQLKALSERPQARWSYTACRHVDAAGAPLPKKSKKPVPMPEGTILRQLLSLEIGIAMPTVVAERSLFMEIGGFDASQRFGEFHDLCLRLAHKAEVVAVPEQLSAIRIHDEHYSSDAIADRQGWLQLYTKMGALADDAQARRICARMRAMAALDLARAYRDSGKYGAAVRTLGHALKFSWRYPTWWWGLLKGIARAFWRRRAS